MMAEVYAQQNLIQVLSENLYETQADLLTVFATPATNLKITP